MNWWPIVWPNTAHVIATKKMLMPIKGQRDCLVFTIRNSNSFSVSPNAVVLHPAGRFAIMPDPRNNWRPDNWGRAEVLLYNARSLPEADRGDEGRRPNCNVRARWRARAGPRFDNAPPLPQRAPTLAEHSRDSSPLLDSPVPFSASFQNAGSPIRDRPFS